MPELPEVETIKNELKTKVRNRTFVGVWTDWPKTIKRPASKVFEKEIKGKKILDIERKGKNILFKLSGEKILLVHQKMTGHLLYGKWIKRGTKWFAKESGPLLSDPKNQFLHIIFSLDDGFQVALSDLRKFAKVELWDSKDFKKDSALNGLGPDPLDSSFSPAKLKEILEKKKGKIKQVLMDQNLISGIGNIYSDEILWASRISPFRETKDIKDAEVEKIYKNTREILKVAIKLKGDSMSDFRRINGEKGGYQEIQKAYARQGKACQRRDGGIIKAAKIGGRTAHFCPVCQK